MNNNGYKGCGIESHPTERTCLIILVWIILFFTIVGFGCHKPTEPKETYESGLFTKKIDVDGQTRRYAIYIPKNIENMSVPLVFELHGGGCIFRFKPATQSAESCRPFRLKVATCSG